MQIYFNATKGLAIAFLVVLKPDDASEARRLKLEVQEMHRVKVQRVHRVKLEVQEVHRVKV